MEIFKIMRGNHEQDTSKAHKVTQKDILKIE